MYSFDQRVRYSEADCSGRLDIAALINYFQDCATMHTTDAGLPQRLLRERGQVWVLSSWQVVISRMPEIDELVTIKTFPYALKGFLGFRNFTLETRSGERLAVANSEWTLVDPVLGRPTRVTEDIPQLYGLDEKLDMDYLPRKIRLEGEPHIHPEPVRVQRHMLDCNGHVNNAQYVRIAADLLPDDFVCSMLRVDYKRPALYGDTMQARIFESGGKCIVALYGEDGLLYVSTEFTG